MIFKSFYNTGQPSSPFKMNQLWWWALWHKGLTGLEGWQPIRECPVQVLATTYFLFSFLLMCLGVSRRCPSPWAPAIHMGDVEEFLAGFSLVQPWLWQASVE